MSPIALPGSNRKRDPSDNERQSPKRLRNDGQNIDPLQPDCPKPIQQTKRKRDPSPSCHHEHRSFKRPRNDGQNPCSDSILSPHSDSQDVGSPQPIARPHTLKSWRFLETSVFESLEDFQMLLQIHHAIKASSPVYDTRTAVHLKASHVDESPEFEKKVTSSSEETPTTSTSFEKNTATTNNTVELPASVQNRLEEQQPTPEAVDTLSRRVSELTAELRLMILEAAVDLLIKDEARLTFNMQYLTQFYNDEKPWYKTAREYICALAPKATLFVETSSVPLTNDEKCPPWSYCLNVFRQVRRIVIRLDIVSKTDPPYPLHGNIRWLKCNRPLTVYIHHESSERIQHSGRWEITTPRSGKAEICRFANAGTGGWWWMGRTSLGNQTALRSQPTRDVAVQ